MSGRPRRSVASKNYSEIQPIERAAPKRKKPEQAQDKEKVSAPKRTKKAEVNQTVEPAVADAAPAEIEESTKPVEVGQANRDADAAASAQNVDELAKAIAAGASPTAALKQVCMDCRLVGKKNHKKWYSCAKYLLENGADATSDCFLLYVCCRDDHPELMQLLIDHGAKNVPERNSHDLTHDAWFYCAFWDNPKNAEVLIQNKLVNFEPSNEAAEIALERALWLGNEAMLKWLLVEKKVNPNLSLRGDPAIVLACSSPLKKKGLVSRVKMLLDAGADRNAVSESGETLLQLAQKAKLPELLKLLKA